MGTSRETARLSHRLRVFLVGLAAAAGMLAASHCAAADAQAYSAYSDPGKTALSFVLSKGENVAELQRKFGLADEEVGSILAAINEEDGKLAREFAQSEKIVASNKSLSDAKISYKIAASDYDEAKDDVEALLPEGKERELEVWVNARWRQEVEAVPDESSARLTETKDDGRRVECRVFGTQYIGYARYEVALPHRGLKFGSRPTVSISSGGRTMRPRVKEVGPRNTYDNHWQPRKHRTMRKGLQRCVPGARASYFNNHNRGKDEYGREIPKPTGVDLTPAARGPGLARYNDAWVYVKIPWLRR